jgi:6-phosphogluconolactonase/glucosamine-6-phosphate isomerase/deaminase
MQSSVFRNRFPFERTTPPKVYSTIVVMDVRDATWRSTSITSLMIFDVNSKVLLAAGRGKDSALHGFRKLKESR